MTKAVEIPFGRGGWEYAIATSVDASLCLLAMAVSGRVDPELKARMIERVINDPSTNK